jgi:hypothetical protein
VAGRGRLVATEIGWGGLGLALAVFGALLLMHPLVFGVVPWPRW